MVFGTRHHKEAACRVYIYPYNLYNLYNICRGSNYRDIESDADMLYQSKSNISIVRIRGRTSKTRPDV